MKNVCLIGGLGFIGSRFREMYALKHAITVIDKVRVDGVDSYQADVCDLDALSKVVRDDSEVIVNLAAEHKDDVTPRSLYYDVNVGGAKNVCIVAREKAINRIVFTSSVAVYGFAPIGTSEDGAINPFNDYGRTKYEAEKILRDWQLEEPDTRSLVIVRPTVVFGERNRGNVYNLLKQIASGKFLMVGSGQNRKSMAYVENVAAFIEYSLHLKPGIHVFNYIDKPDFTMNQLVSLVKSEVGRSDAIGFRLPYFAGCMVGFVFDVLARVTHKKFPISLIRVKKFCSDSSYETRIDSLSFKPPKRLDQALRSTIKYEFVDGNEGRIFYGE